ncbi:hypothetical protein EG327_004699 [Venturia inaequalis]|uniref:Uncharacterized protein n=1 Tax=Venturia inaequalis TaxID=5025 RepID=A0A8H3YI68_VENIN|nr:hypothetical protein EG327_004699 [Venturia inaequalis]
MAYAIEESKIGETNILHESPGLLNHFTDLSGHNYDDATLSDIEADETRPQHQDSDDEPEDPWPELDAAKATLKENPHPGRAPVRPRKLPPMKENDSEA